MLPGVGVFHTQFSVAVEEDGIGRNRIFDITYQVNNTVCKFSLSRFITHIDMERFSSEWHHLGPKYDHNMFPGCLFYLSTNMDTLRSKLIEQEPLNFLNKFTKYESKPYHQTMSIRMFSGTQCVIFGGNSAETTLAMSWKFARMLSENTGMPFEVVNFQVVAKVIRCVLPFKIDLAMLFVFSAIRSQFTYEPSANSNMLKIIFYNLESSSSSDGGLRTKSKNVNIRVSNKGLLIVSGTADVEEARQCLASVFPYLYQCKTDEIISREKSEKLLITYQKAAFMKNTIRSSVATTTTIPTKPSATGAKDDDLYGADDESAVNDAISEAWEMCMTESLNLKPQEMLLLSNDDQQQQQQ